MLVAAFMGWLISQDHEVPWSYRYGALTAIALGLVLPVDVVKSLAAATIGRFTPGNGSSDRK